MIRRRSITGRRGGRERGTSVMEAIVALVLFSSVVVALYQALAAGTRSIRRADQEVAATAIAVARLASAGIEAPLEEGRELTGEDHGYRWRMGVARFVSADERTAQSRMLAYWVTVDVTWGDGIGRPRTVQMKSIKIGLKPADVRP
jgi:hypothetical protein